MEKILVVASSMKGADSLKALIQEQKGEAVIAVCHSESSARIRILDEDWDLIVVNSPLGQERGVNLVNMASEQTPTPVILLAWDDSIDDVRADLEREGVLVVSKPLVREVFWQTLHLARAIQARMRGIQDQNLRLQHQLDEIRLVDKAKWVLVRDKGMTEDQAHHLIEKMAMDQRVSRASIAAKILASGQES